jgi:hypothetical protein
MCGSEESEISLRESVRIATETDGQVIDGPRTYARDSSKSGCVLFPGTGSEFEIAGDGGLCEGADGFGATLGHAQLTEIRIDDL